MATLEEFETTLKEVVNAKRLSASKVEKLNQLALKLMEHDTQLVSTLYRTHKSASGTHKINSLYVFDALARAARHQVDKHKLDVHAIVGNCATFLVKLEGVLDGLFQDILSSGLPEAKEKTKKILDIWLKFNTFPSAVLTSLHKLVKEHDSDKGKGKEPDKTSAAVTTDPRIHAAASTTTPPQAQVPATSAASEKSADSLQSTLLALLSQAANTAATPQTAPNVNSSAAATIHADPVQLALFQQLTQAANAGGSALPNQRVPVLPMSVVPPSAPPSIPPVASPVGGSSQNLPYRDIDRHGYARRDTQSDRFNGPPRGREFYYDNTSQRGGFRGSPRGRGRGRWDDRDRQYDRNRGPDWRPQSQPGRNMQSRSRSPVGRNGRNMRPYSPPRKQPFHQHAPSPPLHTSSGSGPTGPGQDEFGRDIRPPSPHEDSPAPTSSHGPDLSPSRSASSPTEESSTTFPPSVQHEAGSSTLIHPPLPPPTISATSSTSSSAPPLAGGLDSFDLTSFDPTAPASWEGLGTAWNITHGYLPSQDELMQYVISMNSAATFPIMSQYEDTPQRQWSDGHEDGWGGGGSRRGGRGQRGSFARGHDYGNSRGGFRGRGRQFEQDTDALTLAGGDEPTPYSVPTTNYPYDQGQNLYQSAEAYADQANNSSGPSGGGHMERVGDGWVWKGAAGIA